MSEEGRERDNKSTVLIVSTPEDSEGTSSREITLLCPTSRKRARKNVLNPDLAASLDVQT